MTERQPAEAEHATALVVEWRVEAPPETVFSYFVDPEKYRRWKGERAELDPRPGGRYRVNMDGRAVVRGEYVAVDPPHRVVFTWGWEGDAELPPGSTTVEVTLIRDGEATIVRLRHEGFPSATTRQRHAEGWHFFLGRLAGVATGGDPGPNPLTAPEAEL
jgi:uncharacterized protein YndB with AHSA1/START domain